VKSPLARLAAVPDQPATSSWDGLRDEIAADVRRVSDRLRTLSATRLAAPPAPPAPPARPHVGGAGEDHASRAAAGRAVAQRLADAAADLEAAAAGVEPGRRPLPELPDLSVGDQVAVAGHDLLAALDLAGPDTPVGTPGGRRAAEEAVRAAARALMDVRRRL
jgi:hypothetical protein